MRRLFIIALLCLDLKSTKTGIIYSCYKQWSYFLLTGVLYDISKQMPVHLCCFQVLEPRIVFMVRYYH